jgi:hypothetical protein
LKPSIDPMAGVSGRGKRIDELGANLVAAGADRRTNGRMNVRRAGPEFAHQRVNSGIYDASRHASPAGMNRSNRARSCIGKQYGNAVGGANCHGSLRTVRDEGIAGWPLDGGRRPSSDHPHLAAMHLMRRDDPVSADGPRHEPPIVARGERHGTRREHVRGNRLERPAFQHEPA